MHQPLSEESKKSLYNTMGDIIQQYTPILDYFIQYRKQLFHSAWYLLKIQ